MGSSSAARQASAVTTPATATAAQAASAPRQLAMQQRSSSTSLIAEAVRGERRGATVYLNVYDLLQQVGGWVGACAWRAKSCPCLPRHH